MSPCINSIKNSRSSRGFTLTELLVVVALIMAMLMILLPALQAFQKGRVERAANAQLVADLNYARYQAMLNAAPVYVVFFPTYTHLVERVKEDVFPHNNKRVKLLKEHLDGSMLANRLLSGQLTSYAIYAETSAGDQPTYPDSSQKFSNRTYLKPWRRLPPGAHFTSFQMQQLRRINDWVESNASPGGGFTSDESGVKFPAPRPRGLDMDYGSNSEDIDNKNWDLGLDLPLPYIGYGPKGQLLGVHSGLLVKNSQNVPVLDEQGDGYFSIEIATGTVLPPPWQEDHPTFYKMEDADALEERKGYSKYNRIRINMLTGRSDSNVCNVYFKMKYPDTHNMRIDGLRADIVMNIVWGILVTMKNDHGLRYAPDHGVIMHRFQHHDNPLLLESVSLEKAQLFENLFVTALRQWLSNTNNPTQQKPPMRVLVEGKWREEIKFE